MSLTTEIKLEVQRLIGLGRKIEAIKFLTETLDIPLSQAKKLVDAAERNIDTFNPVETQAETKGTSSELTETVKGFLLAGEKMAAIKLVKETENIGLKEALARVEAIEMLMNANYKPGAIAAITRDPFSLVGKIFAGVGILLAFVALVIFYVKQDTIGKSDAGVGYVVEMVPSRSSSASYAPRIEYKWGGQSHVYESATYTSPPAYEVGERVALFINREDPEDIVINTFSGRWLAIIIVGAIGTFFLGFGLLFIFVSSKF